MTEDFMCPVCTSHYLRVRVTLAPRTAERHRLACLVCDYDLESGTDEQVFKYFLMQRGTRSKPPQ
jgi:hypothetical protein